MRPYRRGDRTSWIDWKASARLSAARGTDEFVTRASSTQQAPRVVVVCDRRPGMRLRRAASVARQGRRAEEVLHLLAASAIAERGDLAYADHATERGTWLPPSRSAHGPLTARLASTPWEGPEDGLARSLELSRAGEPCSRSARSSSSSRTSSSRRPHVPGRCSARSCST